MLIVKTMSDVEIESITGGVGVATLIVGTFVTVTTAVITAGWVLGTTLAERDNSLSCPAPKQL